MRAAQQVSQERRQAPIKHDRQVAGPHFFGVGFPSAKENISG
jgi:hypothetical protein